MASKRKTRKRVSTALKKYLASIRRQNPSAFDKCVKSVTKAGYADDPRAVCGVAGRAKYGTKEMTRRSIAGKKKAARRRARRHNIGGVKGRKVKGGRSVTLKNFTGTIVKKSDGTVDILGRGRR